MLTKKYYTLIAKAINESNDRHELINRLCTEFKKDNSLFDSDRFINACNNRINTEFKQQMENFKEVLKNARK